METDGPNEDATDPRHAHTVRQGETGRCLCPSPGYCCRAPCPRACPLCQDYRARQRRRGVQNACTLPSVADSCASNRLNASSPASRCAHQGTFFRWKISGYTWCQTGLLTRLAWPGTGILLEILCGAFLPAESTSLCLFDGAGLGKHIALSIANVRAARGCDGRIIGAQNAFWLPSNTERFALRRRATP